METLSSSELLVKELTNGLRHFVFEIGPWVIVWFLVASPFAWLVFCFQKAKVGRFRLVSLVLLFTGVIAGICAGVHGVLAFGEAFGSAIDNDRIKVFVLLTAMFPPAALWLALRNPRNEKSA